MVIPVGLYGDLLVTQVYVKIAPKRRRLGVVTYTIALEP